MPKNLEAVKNVLHSLIDEIALIKKVRLYISTPSAMIGAETSVLSRIPFVPVPDIYYEEDEAYAWLYATIKYHSLLSKPKIFQIPDYYLQPAQPVYDQWQTCEKEVFCRGHIIPRPVEGCSLIEYLQQLSLTVTEKNEKRAVWVKSLRCFAQWLREDMPLDLHGGLDIIFPRRMTIQRINIFEHTDKDVKEIEQGQIHRERDPEEYPIDIWAASDILRNLAMIVIDGRRSQHSAVQALVFALLCHAVGSARLITEEQIVYDSLLTALNPIDSSTNHDPFSSEYYINIHSLFGLIDVPISKILYDLIQALPRGPDDQRIFTVPLSSLLRTFYTAVDMSKDARNLGKITFRTLMIQSHKWKGYRCRPKASS